MGADAQDDERSFEAFVLIPPTTDIIFDVFLEEQFGHEWILSFAKDTNSSKIVLHLLHLYSYIGIEAPLYMFIFQMFGISFIFTFLS